MTTAGNPGKRRPGSKRGVAAQARRGAAYTPLRARCPARVRNHPHETSKTIAHDGAPASKPGKCVLLVRDLQRGWRLGDPVLLEQAAEIPAFRAADAGSG